MTRLAWQLTPTDGVAVVIVSGSVDEDADFAALARDIAPHKQLRLDLSDIDRINSCGVREWVNFIRAVPDSNSIELVRCSPAFVSQINMISNFTGSARVVSVEAPYVCDACGCEKRVVYEVGSGRQPELPAVPCPECSVEMEFDDIEDSYFAFLS